MTSGERRVYRGECKLAGGKLVAVSIELNHHVRLQSDPIRITSCRIDGDFFINAAHDQLGILRDLEKEIEDLSLPLSREDIAQRLGVVIGRNPDSELVGVNAQTISIALARALDQVPNMLGVGIRRDPQNDSNVSVPERLLTLKDLPQSQQVDFYERWKRLHLNVIMDTAREPAEQMGIDLALLRAVAAGEQPPSLRLWQWKSPAVVIGRFQSLNNEIHVQKARELGFKIVRRISGGGAMFVEPEHVITYSLYLPPSFVSGLNSVEVYRLCDLWMVDGLNKLGIQAGWSGLNDIATTKGKIGGAAQRYLTGEHGGKGGLLHHAMLSYDIDARKMVEVLNVSEEKVADKAVRSAQSRVDSLERQTSMGRTQLIESLVAILQELAPATRLSVVNEQIDKEGRNLSQKYFCSAEWLATIV